MVTIEIVKRDNGTSKKVDVSSKKEIKEAVASFIKENGITNHREIVIYCSNGIVATTLDMDILRFEWNRSYFFTHKHEIN